MGDDYYTVGILSVDRSKNEMRVWVCSRYVFARLPQTHSFFAGILYDMFEYSGEGNASHERHRFTLSYYNETPLLPKSTSIAEKAAANQREGDDDHDDDDEDSDFDVQKFLGFGCDKPADTSPYIEHVEMIRWSEGTTFYEQQAEYLVRLTDDKYLSCKADPCFLGYWFFNTRHLHCNDPPEDTPTIPFGLKQDTPLYPPAHFIVNFERATTSRNYYAQNLTSLDQLLDIAVPKLVAQDPTTFTPDIFLRLRDDVQRQILCVLAFARRPAPAEEPTLVRRSKRLRQEYLLTAHNPFSLIEDDSIFWHIFSFLPLVDQHRLDDVQQVYLGIKYGNKQDHLLWQKDFDLLDYERQVAMKHYSMRTIVSRVCKMCEFKCYELKKEQEEAATAYLVQLRRVAKAMDLYGRSNDDDTFGLMDPRLIPYPKHPLEWVRERVQAASQYDTIQEVLEKVLLAPVPSFLD